MVFLSQRLKMVADLVDVNSQVVDIGTDHAYLPAYLLINKIATKALACDLRNGPLFNAQKTVKKYRLENKLELKLSDGLKEINSEEVDTVIICGMGGNLIVNIISDVLWLKNEKNTLILQPQSHHEDVREFLVQNGFQILKEVACEDNGKLYGAIKSKYKGTITEKPSWYYYFGELIYNKDEFSKKTVQKNLKRLKILSTAQKDYGSIELHKEYETIISEVEVIINENS